MRFSNWLIESKRSRHDDKDKESRDREERERFSKRYKERQSEKKAKKVQLRKSFHARKVRVAARREKASTSLKTHANLKKPSSRPKVTGSRKPFGVPKAGVKFEELVSMVRVISEGPAKDVHRKAVSVVHGAGGVGDPAVDAAAAMFHKHAANLAKDPAAKKRHKERGRAHRASALDKVLAGLPKSESLSAAMKKKAVAYGRRAAAAALQQRVLRKAKADRDVAATHGGKIAKLGGEAQRFKAYGGPGADVPMGAAQTYHSGSSKGRIVRPRQAAELYRKHAPR